MPNIHLFNSYDYRHNPFAKFEYMGVLPTLNALQRFLDVCEYARKEKRKLSQRFLESEKRAYLAIRDNQYVTNNYGWQR